MKVFIAGPRIVNELDECVKQKLENICTKQYEVFVGEADGIDSCIQKYMRSKNYKNVTIFASNGIARNNFGGWRVECVNVDHNITGFEFYIQKDLEMAKQADIGFMIWNGKSRGTFNNIVNCIKLNKEVIIYYLTKRKFYHIKTMDDLYAVSATFNENGITPIAMGEKDKWPGLFPFGVLALRYGGVEATTTLLNGEGNFDQEFVQKTAEELQKMVDEGVFASDSVALTNDEATEEFRQGRAAMWYSGNWQVGQLCGEGSPLEGKLTMVNWPAVSGADGDQNAFVGGASATLVASATSAHKKEAVEFMTFMSEHFSNYAYEEGAILPTWKYSGDMELKPFQQTLLDLMQGADGFCLAWDTLLDPETADVHSTSLQGIYAQQMTADDYVEAMAATR